LPFPGKPGYYSLFKKSGMKKIRLIAKNENVQAGMLAGFILLCIVMAMLFMGK